MDRRPLLPGPVVILLALVLIIILLEKIGQALLSISNVILLVTLAWILTLILRPLVNRVHAFRAPGRIIRPVRQRWGDHWADRLVHPSYGFSIFVVYFLLVTVIAIFVLALVPLVVDQTRQLVNIVRDQASELPTIFQRITDFIDSTRQFLTTRLQIDPTLIVLPRPEEIASQFTNFATNLLTIGISLVGTIAATLGQALLVVFLSVFIMIDGKETSQYLMRLVPRHYADDVRDVFRTSERAFGGFIRGTALQGLIYGLGVMVFMTFFGLGSAIAVGVITGLLMMIPILGGVLGLLLPLTVALLQSSPNTVWLIIVLAVFQVLLFNFITPRLISQSVKIPALLVIIALLIGWQLIGFWGFVFAIPVAAIVYSIGFVILERATLHDRSDDLSETAEQPRE